MTDQAATPETGAVDAPASMDSVLAELTTGNPAPDAADEAVKELVEQAEDGQAEAADDEGETEPAEDEDQPEESDDDLQPEAEQPKPTERYTVKVNGEDRKVTLDELKAGYSRTEDYTAKTMAVAEERKSLETTLSAKYANELKQATDLFVKLDPVLAQADQIDWQALAQEDPTTYTQLRAAVDARLQAVGQARQRLEQVTQQQAQARQEEIQSGIAATEQAIRSSNPDLADEAKLKAYFNDTLGEMFAAGFGQDDVQDIVSHPKLGAAALSLVADARKWRAQEKARKALPQKKVVPVSQAKPLKNDASDSSPSPRRMPRNANTDSRAAFVVNELLSGS